MGPRRLFPWLLTLFVLLGITYSVTVPLGEASDEVSHWSYIQYVAVYHALPRPEGAVLGEAHQPPLYYILGALVSFWVPSQNYDPIANPDFSLADPQAPNVLLHTRAEGWPYQGFALAWHLVRLLSVLLGAITVWGTWQIALDLVPAREWVALSAAAFVAFLPEFLFISAVVNNDNLVVMLSTLGVLQTIRMTRREWRWPQGLILGLILGAALLAKLSGLVLWLFAGAVFAVQAWRTRRWRRAVMNVLPAYGTAAIVVSPWVFHNLISYGDPLGWNLVLGVTPVRVSPMTAADWIWWLNQSYTSFWGRFGGVVNIRLNDGLYVGFAVVALAGLLGWIAYASDALKRRVEPEPIRVLGLSALFWLIMLVAHFRWTNTVEGTDQARQLFPGLGLLAIALCLGLARIFRAREEFVCLTFSGGWGLLGVAVLIYLHGVFSPGPDSRLLDTPSAADFGSAIRVVEYVVDRNVVGPGESVRVELAWQARDDLTENYWLLLQMANKDGTVANRDGVPSAGRVTTDWWRRGDIFTSEHTLAVPVETAPGMYSLRLGLHPAGRWEWLPVTGKDMLELAKITVAPSVIAP